MEGLGGCVRRGGWGVELVGVGGCGSVREREEIEMRENRGENRGNGRERKEKVGLTCHVDTTSTFNSRYNAV